MKKYSFILLLFLTTSAVWAQKQTAWWYFGVKQALHFTDNGPQMVNNSQMYGGKASVTMSDSAGNLLFYGCAGEQFGGQVNYPGRMYTRSHQPMPNGEFSSGEPELQGAIALPVSDSQGQYYFVYHTKTTNLVNGKLLQWAKIDMSLNNGEGAVSLRDQVLSENMCAGLTATRNAQGSGYWIATRRFLYAFSLTDVVCSIDIYFADATGIALINSYPDTLMSSNYYMMFSPDGKYLHQAGKIYNFDNSTGEITTYRTVYTGPWFVNESEVVAFSPSSRYLYSYYFGTTGYCLRQYDLEASDLPASVYVLEGSGSFDNCTGVIKGGMQLGPDGKIYITHASSTAISVIAQPDMAGADCMFNLYSIQLNHFAHWDLPNFPTDLLANAGSVSTIIPKSPVQFDIGPSPATSLLQYNAATSVSLQLFDPTGRLVLTHPPTGPAGTVDISALRPGIYFVQAATSEGEKAVKKIVKI